MEIVRVRDLAFQRKGVQILQDINWTVRPGEHWVVIGPNGSGKSTLTAIIAAANWPSRGRVEVLGETYGRVNLREFRKRLGLFQPAQQHGLDLHHHRLTALDVIMTGADGNLAVYDEYEAPVRERALDLFDRYMMTDAKSTIQPERLFRKLSSGERRRVLLLRVLMGSPELLILDEPFESLDIPSRLFMEKLLDDFTARERVHTITIVHRIEEIPRHANHALLLRGGRVFAAGPADEIITSENLSRLYDVKLFVGRRGPRFYWVPEQDA